MRVDRSLKVFSLFFGVFFVFLSPAKGQTFRITQRTVASEANSFSFNATGSKVNNANSFTRSPAVLDGHSNPLDKSMRRPFGKSSDGTAITDCGLPSLPNEYRGTLGGSGLVNGYFFNSAKKLCEATRDYGSATPRGPFETLEDCEEAVARGSCD